jgi:very-short-patch-repair endonuclease
MKTALENVALVTSKQHGLATWRQLRDSGVSERRIHGLVDRGHLRRVRPQVYCLAGSPSTWEQALLAAVMSVGDGGFASHSSAARLWTFAHSPESEFEITVGRERATASKGIRLHRSGCLDESDVATRNGIRCSTFERTLCDCTTVLSHFQLGRTLDDGLRRGVASISRLRECARRLESGPGRRMSIIRSLLAQRGLEFVPGGSAAELRVLDVLRETSLPRPVQQHVVRVDGRRFELDYAWPEHRVFVEYYGLNVHSRPSAVAYDSERLNLLTSLGWIPLIFTDASTDREIRDRTAAALERQVGTLTYRRGA